MEKNRAPQTVAQLAQFMESLLDNREIWISACAVDGEVLLWNKAAETISGYTRDEVEGNSNAWRWVYPDDEYRQEIMGKMKERMFNREEVEDYESNIRCRDGRIKIVSWNSRVLSGEGGEPLGLVCIGRDITRQKNVEAELRESVERYKTLFEASGFAVFIVKDTTIIGCNTKTLELFRGTREQIVGSRPHMLSPRFQPDGRSSEEKGEEFLAKVLEGEPQRFEWLHTRFDGSYFHAEITLTPLGLEAGKYTQCVIQDVTRRKRGEEELRVERDLNKKLIDTSPAFIVAIDRDGKVMLMNQAMLKTLGYTKEEVAGSDYIETFVPPEEYESVSGVFKNLIVAKKRTLNENYVLAKDGRQFLVEWHGRPVYNAKGEVDSFFGVGVDISERKIAEEALKQSEMRFRQMTQLLPQSVWETDIQGNLTYANFEAFKAFKYNSWDFEKGLNAVKMLALRDRPRAMNNFKRVLEGEELGGSEYTALRKDGTTFPVVIYSNSIKYGDTPVGMRGIVVDISAHKEAEEKEKQYMQQLMQADKMISLGTLVSGVAHEINNPNNAIMFNVPLLQDIFDDLMPVTRERIREDGDFEAGGIPGNELEDSVRQLLEAMERSADRIKNIVEDLKNFARQEPVEINQVVQVNEVVKSSVTLLNNMINKCTRNFSAGYGKEVPTVKGNFQRLEQVVINLIQNACQALKDKENAIRVTTVYDHRKSVVKISVKDEGKGIADKDIKYVTDPFFTTKRDIGGTGLGLSISSRIIEDHGGRLEVKSKKGTGSTFTVVLPVKPAAGKRKKSFTGEKNKHG